VNSSVDENHQHGILNNNGSERDKKEVLLSKSSLLRAAMQRSSGIA